jgi:tetratricopeptide (TPR) repeat protein
MRTSPKTKASNRRIATVLSPASSFSAAFAAIVVAMAVGVAPAELQSQQERALDRILILTPSPEDPGDSSYVHEMTDFLRTRAQNKFRRKWHVIGRDVIEELFVTSGFPPNTIIGSEMVEQVGRSLQARGYMYGVLRRDGQTPYAIYRMVDLNRSGLSGWLRVQGQPGDPPRSFADRVADSLDNQVRAADYAKDCAARRDRSEFDRARDAVERAFRLYPNHPSSAICLSYVYQALQYGVDSVIFAYEKATKGDSLLFSAWEDLAREYVRAGDTLNAVGAYEKLLANDPSNIEIRRIVALGYFTAGDIQKASEVLDEGLRRDPGNMQFVRLKQRVCLEGEDWQCALETSELMYQMDSTLAGNMEFYQSIIGLAGTVGDTATMLKWYETALESDPESQQLLVPYAAVLEAAEGTDSAMFVYRKLRELNPTDIRYSVKVIEYEVGKFEIDTTAAVPIDTAELERLDSLLQDFAQTNQGNDQMETWVGGQYLSLTQKLAQSQLANEMTVEWAEKALSYDRVGALTAAGNFWLGYALFFITTAMDAQIMESQSCRAIDVYERNLQRTRQALTAGRSISAETVDNLMGYLQQLAERPAQFREYFKCGGR